MTGSPPVLSADDAVLALFNHGLIVTDICCRIIKPSKGRPVLHYAVEYREPGREDTHRTAVIAKAYYRGDGAATFAGMQLLWAAGFADSPFTIPEPVAWLAPARLLVQGVAPGRALYEHIDHPDTGLPFVRRVGEWLAKLHSTHLEGTVSLDQERRRAQLDGFAVALGRAWPVHARRFEDYVRLLLDLEVTSRGAPAVPTHGDFQPKNVHVHGERVTVIDFDRFALAAPARDLGHFLAQSMTMSYVRSRSFTAIERWNEAFLEGYAEQRPDIDVARLALATIESLIEILYYKLVVRPVRDAYFLPSWLEKCDDLLERARG